VRALLVVVTLVSIVACSNEELVWPIANSSEEDADIITSPYGPRDQSGEYDFHAGVDFALPEGTKVRAIKAGTIEKAEEWDGEDGTGTWVLVDHGGGEKSAYLHLSKISVQQGESVHAGQVIGRSGSTGNTSPHLHLTYMVGVDHDGADEARARNLLELLPHSPMPEPTVSFTADSVVVLATVMPMTIQHIRLEGAGQVREVDYADIAALGNPDRDEQTQSGLWIGVVDVNDDEAFEMTLRPDPPDFVPERVVLTDFDGEVVLDASR
jgi:murein DD-endopeptidase MepM/ murein hydrolase activator NlpD